MNGNNLTIMDTQERDREEMINYRLRTIEYSESVERLGLTTWISHSKTKDMKKTSAEISKM